MIKTKEHKGVKKLTLQTKSKADSIIKLSDDIKKGKNVPAIKVHNTKALVSDLKNKGLSKKEREDVLQEIMFNNEKRILKLKNQLLDRKLKKQNKKSAKKINKTPVKRNASSYVFKPIYSDAQIKKQEELNSSLIKDIENKKSEIVKFKEDLIKAKVEIYACSFVPLRCKSPSKINPSLSMKENWDFMNSSEGLPKIEKELRKLEDAKDEAYIKLNNMISENETELARQIIEKEEYDAAIAKHNATMKKIKWEQERYKKQKEREQEQKEADLRKKKLKEDALKLELEEQTKQLNKLESELKNNSNVSNEVLNKNISTSEINNNEKISLQSKIIGGVLFSIILLGVGYMVLNKK